MQTSSALRCEHRRRAPDRTRARVRHATSGATAPCSPRRADPTPRRRRFLPPLLYAAGHGGRPLDLVRRVLPAVHPAAERRRRRAASASTSPTAARSSCAASMARASRCASGRRPASASARVSPASDAAHSRAGTCRCSRSPTATGAASATARSRSSDAWPPSRSLVSFVRITADARHAAGARRSGWRSPAGQSTASVAPARTAEVDAAFVHRGARLQAVDADAYSAARAAVVAFWQRASRSRPLRTSSRSRGCRRRARTLIQELEITWRYSVGNVYEELSFAEALDVAQVMAGYGYGDVARQILRFTLERLPRALHVLAGRRAARRRRAVFPAHPTTASMCRGDPGLAPSSTGSRASSREPHGLLPARALLVRHPRSRSTACRARRSSGRDCSAMSRVWAATGYTTSRSVAPARRPSRRPASVARCGVGAAPAGRLALRPGSSARRRGTVRPVDRVARRHLLESRGARTRSPRVLRAARRRATRSPALPDCGTARGCSASSARGHSAGGRRRLRLGTDEVYGINVARFLADDRPAGPARPQPLRDARRWLDPGTYVAARRRRSRRCTARCTERCTCRRTTTSAAFLETLRMMLVHEARGPSGLPTGLELAFATPRTWLRRRQVDRRSRCADQLRARELFDRAPPACRADRGGRACLPDPDDPRAASASYLRERGSPGSRSPGRRPRPVRPPDRHDRPLGPKRQARAHSDDRRLNRPPRSLVRSSRRLRRGETDLELPSAPVSSEHETRDRSRRRAR